MDREFAFVRAVAETREFQSIMAVLFAKWGEEAFAFASDLLMERFNLECIEYGFHSIVVYPHGTRRTRPAFLSVHYRGASQFDFKSSLNKGAFIIEVVEAGKYGVAGASKEVVAGAEAEDTALLN